MKLPLLVDAAVAQWMVDEFDPKFIYSNGQFYTFDGLKYVYDETNKIMPFIDENINKILKEIDDRRLAVDTSTSAGVAEVKRYNKLYVDAMTFLNTNKMFAVRRQLSLKLTVPYEQLDTDYSIVNTLDGVLDLTNGDMLPPGHGYNTMCAGGLSDGVEMPTFMQLLRYNFSDDEIEYLQALFGCAMLRKVSKLFVNFVGVPNSGKSFLINYLSKVFGDYAVALPPDAFTKKKASQSTRDDLLRAQHAMLAYVDEVVCDNESDWSMVKAFTGGSQMSLRGLYQRNRDFRFSGLVINTTNNPPQFDPTDAGAEIRFLTIPFTTPIPVPTEEFKDALDNEGPKVLRWIVNGAMRVKNEGMPKPPERFVSATKDNILDNSVVERFIQRCMVVDLSRPTDTTMRMPLGQFQDMLSEYCFEVEKWSPRFNPNHLMTIKRVCTRLGVKIIERHHTKIRRMDGSETTATDTLIGIRPKTVEEKLAEKEKDLGPSP